MTNENSSRRSTDETGGPPAAETTATTGPSRRRLLKSGVLAASGALVYGPGRVGAAGDRDDASESSTRGAMFPYQFTPDARFTVREADLEWRPERVDPDYAAHVVEYEFARSLRSVFFAETELAEGRTFRATGPRASPVEADRRLVGVVAEPAGD